MADIIDSLEYPRKTQKFHLQDKMDSTTALWTPIKKEHNKTDNGGTVNINNMGSYIVRKYVNEINYAYTYTQKIYINKT